MRYEKSEILILTTPQDSINQFKLPPKNNKALIFLQILIHRLTYESQIKQLLKDTIVN